MSEVSSWRELWSDGPWLVITVSSCMYPRQTQPWCSAAFTYIKLISVRACLWFSLPALSQAVCQYCWHNAEIFLTLLYFFSLLGVFFSLPPTLTLSSTLSFLFLFFLTLFLCHALVFSLSHLRKNRWSWTYANTIIRTVDIWYISYSYWAQCQCTTCYYIIDLFQSQLSVFSEMNPVSQLLLTSFLCRSEHLFFNIT